MICFLFIFADSWSFGLFNLAAKFWFCSFIVSASFGGQRLRVMISQNVESIFNLTNSIFAIYSEIEVRWSDFEHFGDWRPIIGALLDYFLDLCSKSYRAFVSKKLLKQNFQIKNFDPTTLVPKCFDSKRIQAITLNVQTVWSSASSSCTSPNQNS